FSMLHPLKVITQVYTDIRKALVSLDRIGLVLNQESRIQDKPDAITKETFDSEITFENVTFGYKENKPVLKNFSLTIPKGSKVAFVGASGGGKTTIANLMNRLYDVTYGAIKIDGIDIRDIKLDNLRKFFGVVTQDSILFSKSIKENIAYGSQEEVSDEQIIKAAQIANAEEFINEMPNKYDEVLGSKGSDLSGGQKQRLCIARAIVGDPPILIFDEATSALDTDSEQKVQMAIDKATQNRTVILIAHRLSTILKADKIVVLEKGKIVGMGTHQELMQNCPRYQHLYNLQQGK
ncbi:MAG TPA: ABC transporter ATP-binding protein, partial [Candidatus Cloacimonas acidaminovorans]|nr:ABC transporter ATP-binding protein [Candidatus Cloacimonas acidaminovorans]